MSSPPPIVIVRLPYDRPHDGGAPDPTPVEWSAEKERILWQELSSSRTHVHQEIDWQSLAARLVVPLPYLLYKTQARYEEDLRKIHEVKPIMSDAPLHRRTLSEDGKRIPTLSRRTSSRAETIMTVPRSPRNLDKIVLPNLSSSRVQYAGTTGAVRSPTTLKNGASGSAVVSKALSSSSPSSETDSESIEDEGERKNEEREDVNRKLKELAKLVKSDGFGFAAGPSKDHRLSSGGAASGKGKEKQKEHMEVPCLSDVPETGESGREEEPESPPTTDSTSAGAHRRPQMAVKVTTSRTSRFSRDAIPSMPSSSSHSPSESPGRVANAYHPYEQTNSRTKPIPPRLEGEMQRHRSLSSQGSQASSFSDLSDASITASALEDVMLSRAGVASRMSMFARGNFATR